MSYTREFKAELIRQNLSENTVKNYVRAVQDFYLFLTEAVGEEIPPGKITEIDLREYKSYLLNQKKQSPSTINSKLAGLIKYGDFLMAQGVLNSNPAKAVDRVKVQNGQMAPRTLAQNDLYRLRRTFHKGENPRDILIFELSYNTGVRVSELCNIELDDIEMSERKGTVVIREGRGLKYRTIPLNSHARNAITAYIEVRPLTVNKKLLQGQRGPLRREAVFKIVRKYADLAGIKDVSPHTLRHQFCKDLLDSGVDIVTVANLAGHRDINTTAIYTQPSEEEKAQALEKL